MKIKDYIESGVLEAFVMGAASEGKSGKL